MLSFRTERSVVKNLGSTKVNVHEILRFALDDKIEKDSVESVVKKNKKLMENENRTIWGKILKITITLLTALATAFGIQACV